MNKSSKIFLAGHNGLVGSAIHKVLKFQGYNNLILRNHSELDLMIQRDVEDFFRIEKPEYVILAAAKVGGIAANNKYRADFIYENIMIQSNVIHQSYLNGVKKLLFLGSTCIYPKNTNQPIVEDSLLTSKLEYTNEPYAIAKIAGIKMCESYNLQYGTNFISAMPTNLYGPNDNFDLEKSHVLPALLRKIYLAKCLKKGNIDLIKLDLEKNPVYNISAKSDINDIIDILSKYGITNHSVEIWGSGKPMREFLWSEDMAEACCFLMKKIDFVDIVKEDASQVINTHINLGTGIDISIKNLAFLIKDIVQYDGELIFNKNKPDGTYKKLTNVNKINTLGWKHKVNIEDGIRRLFDWYLNR